MNTLPTRSTSSRKFGCTLKMAPEIIMGMNRHPNGWEGSQQSQMREAAILANFVPDAASAANRIKFLSEGEASLHACVDRGWTNEALRVRVTPVLWPH